MDVNDVLFSGSTDEDCWTDVGEVRLRLRATAGRERAGMEMGTESSTSASSAAVTVLSKRVSETEVS